jgi:Flp pilus assembly protein TadD
VALLQAGDLAGAAEALRRAVEAEPDWTEPRIGLGVACAAAGDWACVDAQRAALRGHPAELATLDRMVERTRR